MKEFYQQTVKEVLDRVESRETGLTGEQAGKSRERCGWNELAEGKKKSIPQIFLEQYKDFLVLILIASAIISGMLGDAESAAVILDRDHDQCDPGHCADHKSGAVSAELKEACRTAGQGTARWFHDPASGKRAGGWRCDPGGSRRHDPGGRKAD